MALTYLLAFDVLVADPFGHGFPPVLDQGVLGELLSLAVAETALRLHGRDHVILSQVDLQPIARLVRRLLTRTPGAAVALDSNAVNFLKKFIN